MSPNGIDAYRTASVLGYCLLPLVLVSLASIAVSFECVQRCLARFDAHSGLIGYLLAAVSILWCSYAASGIFVSVLSMTEQRLLVAYPVGLFYTSFALLSVFPSSLATLSSKVK